jgi:hypothetical protein
MKTKNRKETKKIANRDTIIGTFGRILIPDETDALVRYTDRGLIIDYDCAVRRGFYFKRVDAPRSRKRGRAVYKAQFTKQDIEALLSTQYDHLVIHLGGADYPYCVVTRAEFLSMSVSVGGCIEVIYQRGNRKFRVTSGVVGADQPMRIGVRRYWHSAQANEAILATAA